MLTVIEQAEPDVHPVWEFKSVRISGEGTIVAGPTNVKRTQTLARNTKLPPVFAAVTDVGMPGAVAVTKYGYHELLPESCPVPPVTKLDPDPATMAAVIFVPEPI
jgi:hypothetical protein